MTEQVLMNAFIHFNYPTMKNKTLIVVLAILTFFTGSCKKKYHFNTSDITVTDINGNYTGNINTNDWKLHKFSDASDFDKKVFQDFQNSQNVGASNFQFSNFKSNCMLPDTFNLVAYPNPMIGNNCSLFFKLNKSVSFNYSYGIVILTDKLGKTIRSSGFPNAGNWEERTNALTIRDFIYYGIFVTTDSCLFYTKGNVIGCDL